MFSFICYHSSSNLFYHNNQLSELYVIIEILHLDILYSNITENDRSNCLPKLKSGVPLNFFTTVLRPRKGYQSEVVSPTPACKISLSFGTLSSKQQRHRRRRQRTIVNTITSRWRAEHLHGVVAKIRTLKDYFKSSREYKDAITKMFSVFVQLQQICQSGLVRKLSKLQRRLQCFFVSCNLHGHGQDLLFQV